MASYDFVDFDPQPALTRRATCSHKELGPVITRLFSEAMAANSETELVAPPMVTYLDWRPADCDIEIGLPVDASTEPGAGSGMTIYPACTAVHVTHTGPYEGLMQAWADFWNEVLADNVEVGGSPWDSYAVGPDQEPNPANWVTDLYIPMSKS